MKFLQKTFLTGLFSLFLFGNATTQAQSFADVSSDHPYYEAIEYAKNNNIVKGYNNGLFSPFKTINRAEFTKIIIESLYSEEEISSCDTEKFSFPDVKNSDWFAKYVCVAKKEKIINGYADGTFKASNTITLPEAMKIILDLAMADSRVHADPAPWARVTNLGDSSVDISVRIWCDATDYWELKFGMIKDVKEAFDAKGISIPYPHSVEIHKEA